jgi:hypothetical protein
MAATNKLPPISQNFQQSHFHPISRVLHETAWLDIWPSTSSVYNAYTHRSFRKPVNISFHSHPLGRQHSIRYAYVQVVYISTFLRLFFLILFLNTISNILLIFNYSLECLWIICWQGSIWGKFDRCYVCFDHPQSHLFARSFLSNLALALTY